jgi:hypothetical protein
VVAIQIHLASHVFFDHRFEFLCRGGLAAIGGDEVLHQRFELRIAGAIVVKHHA